MPHFMLESDGENCATWKAERLFGHKHRLTPGYLARSINRPPAQAALIKISITPDACLYVIAILRFICGCFFPANVLLCSGIVDWGSFYVKVAEEKIAFQIASRTTVRQTRISKHLYSDSG